jgi:hypothetical protein
MLLGSQRRGRVLLLVLSVLVYFKRDLPGQTLVLDDATIVRQQVHRLGLNLGMLRYYGSQQMYRNIFGAQNVGFEPFQMRQIWAENVPATTSTFITNERASAVPTDAMAGAHFEVVESRTANKGCKGTVAASTGKTTAGVAPDSKVVLTLASPCPVAMELGDIITLTRRDVPTSSSAWAQGRNGITVDNVAAGVVYSSDVTTPYSGSQALVIDTTHAGGKDGQVRTYADTAAHDRFVSLEGPYVLRIATRRISGGATVNVSAKRIGTAVGCILPNIVPSDKWSESSITCKLEEGPYTAPAAIQLTIQSHGSGVVEIDDVSFTRKDETSPNHSEFRSEVINTIKAWCGQNGSTTPCTLRDWTGQDSEDFDNWIRPQGQVAITSDSNRSNVMSGSYTPRLQDFLRLCQAVGAVPYIEIPSTFDDLEAAHLLEYLSSPDVTGGYGSRRAAQGQRSPWVGSGGVFQDIYLSYANEAWNSSTFLGANLPARFQNGNGDRYQDYTTRASGLFATLRKSRFFTAGVHLGFDLQTCCKLPDSDLSLMAARGGAPDYFEVESYSGGNLANWQTDEALWGAMLQEPYSTVMSPAGRFAAAAAAVLSRDKCGAHGTAHCGLTVYEENNGIIASCGAHCEPGNPHNVQVDQPHLDAANAGAAQGIIQPLLFQLQMQRFGTAAQNFYSLSAYDGPSAMPGLRSKLYSSVVDMGGACSHAEAKTFGGSFCPRPSFLGIEAANTAVIGPMFACHLKDDPTYNWPGDPYNGAPRPVSGVPYLYSFCYRGANKARSIDIINTNLRSGYKIRLAGTGLPSGAVTLTQFSATDPSALNEAHTGKDTNQFPAPLHLHTEALHWSNGELQIPPLSITTLVYISGS